MSSFCLGVMFCYSYVVNQNGEWMIESEAASTKSSKSATPTTISTRTSNTSRPLSKFTPHFHPASQEMLDRIPNLIEPRVWDFWSEPIPCFEPDPELGWLNEWHPQNGGDVGSHSHLGGLLMVKPAKVGGSTAAGVHLRIMHQIAQRQGKEYPVCRGSFRHGRAFKYADIAGKSFMWSVIRDPTKRAISEFFHFGVSRRKIEPTDEAFLEYLHMLPPKIDRRKLGHYGDRLPLQDANQRKGMDLLDLYKGILPSYNFIAVTERMDESLVVLKELLGLNTSDILYLSAKTNGGWDDGKMGKQCSYIRKSYVSPGMKEIFESAEWFSKVEYDMALHIAVNKSLDLTIEKAIGRDRFDRALQDFQNAQLIAREHCNAEATYPCSPGGERRSDNETDCYWGDAGCGYPCVDRVVEELGL